MKRIPLRLSAPHALLYSTLFLNNILFSRAASQNEPANPPLSGLGDSDETVASTMVNTATVTVPQPGTADRGSAPGLGTIPPDQRPPVD